MYFAEFLVLLYSICFLAMAVPCIYYLFKEEIIAPATNKRRFQPISFVGKFGLLLVLSFETYFNLLLYFGRTTQHDEKKFQHLYTLVMIGHQTAPILIITSWRYVECVLEGFDNSLSNVFSDGSLNFDNILQKHERSRRYVLIGKFASCIGSAILICIGLIAGEKLFQLIFSPDNYWQSANEHWKLVEVDGVARLTKIKPNVWEILPVIMSTLWIGVSSILILILTSSKKAKEELIGQNYFKRIGIFLLIATMIGLIGNGISGPHSFLYGNGSEVLYLLAFTLSDYILYKLKQTEQIINGAYVSLNAAE